MWHIIGTHLHSPYKCCIFTSVKRNTDSWLFTPTKWHRYFWHTFCNIVGRVYTYYF